MGSVGSRYGPVSGSCERDNEPSGFGTTELVITIYRSNL
jgi:hypothetical protein